MTILDSSMVSLCREMGIRLMKTSYSTIFNEGLDFTCGLADTNGEMIAVAEFCPAQIGGMPLLMKTCAQGIPFDTLEEGDLILHNDPYRGGLHVPEHTFFKPFYVDAELMGFAVCIGHVSEVGGMARGAFAGEATEISREGLRVPPVKIKKRGQDVEEVWKLLLANVRTPRYNYGDYRAMIGALDLGEQRIGALIRKYGKPVFKHTCGDLMDYSERRMRSEIAAFPGGRYSCEVGAGAHRGGLGFRRTLRAVNAESTASQCTDRHRVPIWSLFGGKGGANGATLSQRGGSSDWLTARQAFGKVSSSEYANIRLMPDDRVRITVSGGGGGFGDPRKRDRTLIEKDLREGYISIDGVRRDYDFTVAD